MSENHGIKCRCPKCEVNRNRIRNSVFDAAMALAAVARSSALESSAQLDAYYRLIDACRKAEEVER